MLQVQYMFEKSKLNKKQKNGLFLVELLGVKSGNINKKMKLNVSFAIDISTSMNDMLTKNNHSYIKPPYVAYGAGGVMDAIVNIKNNAGLGMGNILHRGYDQPVFNSYQNKLAQAKNAAISAVRAMKKGDIVSIVSFDDRAEVVVPATKISKNNIEDIVKKISGLYARGSTNLHEGWATSATEVAKNISVDRLNRVVVLSDGETNRGVVSTGQISDDVMKLYAKQISTSTFGIGDRFNEDLLLAMANNGGGNFYYIEKDSQIDEFFREEFSGMENLAAQQIEVSVEFSSDVKIAKEYNSYSKTSTGWIIPSITKSSRAIVLLGLDFGKLKTAVSGMINVKYLTLSGEVVNQSLPINVEVVGGAEYDKLPFNDEVRVQEVLMTVAQNKINATRAIDVGDMEAAKNFLNTSNAYVAASGLSDSRLASETVALNATLVDSDIQSAHVLRKSLSNQSYKTRYNK